MNILDRIIAYKYIEVGDRKQRISTKSLERSKYFDRSTLSLKANLLNPEKSGIHNNYLMVMVEQGVPGFIIMMILAMFPLVYGERLYHQLKNIQLKRLLMAAILSFLAIDIFIIINDLLEADKVGPFYFLNLAILVFMSFKK